MARLALLATLKPSPRLLAHAGLLGEAALLAVQNQILREWAGSPPHRWLIAWPKPRGPAAAPQSLRPIRPRRGQAVLAGRFVFDGLEMDVGPGGDPWNRAAPSKAFAVALHGMEWLADLLATEGGARTALSLVLGWVLTFGRWNAFAWSAPVLERRLLALACALRPLLAEAAPAEAAALLDSLARQARHLLTTDWAPARRAERMAAAAVAACALAGPAGERILASALAALDKALPLAVLPDGGHASRSPEAGMELLLDLRCLDQVLAQRGRPAPPELARAIDRLTGALHLFRLADGRLPASQGGEACDPARIQAALAGAEPARIQPLRARHAGYERLEGGPLQVMVDAGAPAMGAWSTAACAQPLAIEVLAEGARLITGSGWSPRAAGAQGLRLTPAASTASISDLSCGQPLTGRLAEILGPRLEGGPQAVRVGRHDEDGLSWLELAHDGWAEAFALVHERRLYFDARAGELRGEDQLIPAGEAPPRARRPQRLVVRFQLHPEVKASLALDGKSILLQPGSGRPPWWLRNDAAEAALEPAVHLEDGRPRPAQQIVLRASLGPDRGARIRWKLGR